MQSHNARAAKSDETKNAAGGTKFRRRQNIYERRRGGLARSGGVFAASYIVVVVVVVVYIINHPDLSTQYLLLSQFLRTSPTLDSADLWSQVNIPNLEKIYQIKWTPRVSRAVHEIQHKI